MVGLIILLAITTPGSKQPLRDDGFGACPAFTHYHPTEWEFLSGEIYEGHDSQLVYLDGLCHRDDTDEPVKELPKLPKPKFKPDPDNVWL